MAVHSDVILRLSSYERLMHKLALWEEEAGGGRSEMTQGDVDTLRAGIEKLLCDVLVLNDEYRRLIDLE